MSGTRDDRRLLREFVGEAEEMLERAGETLGSVESTLEDTPAESVNAFFRSVHSLKGLAGMVGVNGVTDAAHAFEALLDAVRMGRVPLDKATAAAAAEGLAGLAGLVKRIAAGEPDPMPGSGLVSRLAAAARPRSAARADDGLPLVLSPELERVVTDYERHRIRETRRKGRQVLALDLHLPIATFDEGLRRAMAEASSAGELIGTFPGDPPDPETMSFVLLVGAAGDVDVSELVRRSGASASRTLFAASAVRETEPEPAPPPAPPPSESSLARAGGTVRVPVERIAQLLDLVGQLAVAKNAVKHVIDRAVRETSDRNLRYDAGRTFASLERAISGLSRAALATRLVPVDQLASRLARAARSIAASLGKDVELEVVGGETELDKVLADELADPLLHILRNALGHGIETPEERRRAGKSPNGRVVISAETRGRDVAISIADDGRGIEPARVLSRAREKRLLADGEPDPADPMSVLFLPGFSTAEAVSELSGRGVGLDVVRSRIQAIEGSVSVRSTAGEGTTFEIVLPITLALVESVLVEDGGITYAFPGTSVARMVPLEPARLVREGGREILLDEGGPVEIAPLARLLGRAAEDGGDGKTVVVAERGSRRAGFVVSRVEGLVDLIVKPLPPAIARAPEITGAAELPDGALALTLDAGLLVDRVLAGAAA